MTAKALRKCGWALRTLLEEHYHDHEWGVPLHDDRRLFEFLVLEGAQAGLSWSTILSKREGYRQAFDRFDVEKVARYDEDKIAELTLNPAIIRNKLKIASAVANARAFIAVQDQFGSFDRYIWRFVDGQPVHNDWQTLAQVPASTRLSEILSKDLVKRGFKFVGPTICYAHMQATGMVNDHVVDCFRHAELKAAYPPR